MIPYQEIALGDPISPNPVTFSFDAIGWTILAYGLILTILLLAIIKVRIYRRNAYRRNAIGLITGYRGGLRDKAKYSNQILRRVALAVLPRTDVSKPLKEFLQVLNNRLSKPVFEERDIHLFETLNYGDEGSLNDTDLEAHLVKVEYWIKHHR